MRGVKRPVITKREMQRKAVGKQELLMRRTANQRAHVITAHGNIKSGRKGR